MDLLALTRRPKDKFIQFALDLRNVKHPERLKFPMLASEKIDGVFCLAYKHTERVNDYYLHSRVSIYSRTGERFTSMEHIEIALNEIMELYDIIIFEACGPQGIPQSTVSGWCRDTKAQHPELMAACHDLLNQEEFINGGRRCYAERFMDLKTRINAWRRTLATYRAYWLIFALTPKPVGSLKEAQEYAEEVWSNGGEGVVLRNPDGLYAPGKRNEDILKIKRGVSYDLEVVGLKEGKGKYAGTLGTLVCRWRDDKTIEISGMTDEQRREWWKNPHGIIGKIVQVDAMGESTKGLLREPRFKGIRWDKTKGDF